MTDTTVEVDWKAIIPQQLADLILATALANGEAPKLLVTLFEGGSVTYDPTTGRNVYATAEQLDALMAHAVRIEEPSTGMATALRGEAIAPAPQVTLLCGEQRGGGSLVVAGHCGTRLQADGRCAVHGYPAHIIRLPEVPGG